MDDQRLERALREGPPFTANYAVQALPLDRAPTGAMARVRPMVLLLAAVALLLVALTTALIVGALRSSALAFTCADAADAMDRNVQGWTVHSDPGAAEDAKAGMLTGFFRSSGDEPPPPPALIDPDSGQLCATVKFANGAWLQEASLFRWSPSGDALAMATERNRDGDKRGHDLLVVSEAGIVQSAVQSDWTLNFAWSPDSHRIAAFSNFESFFARSVDVWIVPDDGSGPQELAIECATMRRARRAARVGSAGRVVARRYAHRPGVHACRRPHGRAGQLAGLPFLGRSDCVGPPHGAHRHPRPRPWCAGSTTRA